MANKDEDGVELKKGGYLQMGVHIPMPWLLGIIGSLLFNAGVVYTQFSDLKDKSAIQTTILQDNGVSITKLNSRVDLISERMSQNDLRQTAQDFRTENMDNRLRRVEIANGRTREQVSFEERAAPKQEEKPLHGPTAPVNTPHRR